jgi:Cerato-platanin
MDSIGGASVIKSWNSPNCGTCWQLTYTNDKGKSTSINLLAVDVADDGFNVSLEAMNALTNNLATELGRIDVQSVQVDASTCGL